MNVHWCEVHKSTNHTYARCGWSVIEGQRDDFTPCRFVEMQLVPVNPIPAPYDIEIPDFVNRTSMGW